MAFNIIQRVARIWRGPGAPEPAIVYLDSRCRCAKLMGNEFWFLPTGTCLYGKCNKERAMVTITGDDLRQHREVPETYLGDAVYASFDGFQIWLRTGDGNAQSIALEPAVYAALVAYVDGIREACRRADEAARPPASTAESQCSGEANNCEQEEGA